MFLDCQEKWLEHGEPHIGSCWIRRLAQETLREASERRQMKDWSLSSFTLVEKECCAKLAVVFCGLARLRGP